MPLPQLFNHKDTVQLTAMIKDIRKHVTAKFDALSCGCRCHLEEMLCSVISNSTDNWTTRPTPGSSTGRGRLKYLHSSFRNSRFIFHFTFTFVYFFWCLQYFRILQYFYIFLLSCAHLLLNKGRDTKVFKHLIYLKFIHHIFPLVLYFTFVSEAFCFVHYLYIFAFQIISPSALTFNNANTPEEKERYHT
jgi:hypothetical protein